MMTRLPVVARHFAANGTNLPAMVETTKSVAVLAPFGLDPFDEQVYRVVLRHSGAHIEVLADAAGAPTVRFKASARRLARVGLARMTTDSVVAEPAELAIGQLIDTETQRLRDAQHLLTAARSAIPEFRAEQRLGSDTMRTAGGFELVRTEQMADTLIALVADTTGEMLFLRPDQWGTPGAALVDPHVISELQRGRPSRALYPHEALDEAAEPVQARGRAGERVRVLRHLPSRLAIFGEQAALIPDSWEQRHGDRLLIRQPGAVRALRTLFDELWRRGTAVPGLSEEPDDRRHQLLELLQSGAIDEQVARTLGISLRTVRRRIAGLMAELDATSRFQLGAEAVRRGWL